MKLLVRSDEVIECTRRPRGFSLRRQIPAHRTVYARVRGREQVPCGCVAKPAVLRYFPARMSYALVCRRCANCVEGCDCANLQSEISRRSCMPKPLLEDVFKRSGLPTYTFVEPAEYNHLKIALRTPGRGVVVEGPSGIGKTTAVRRAASDVGVGDRAQMLSGRNREDQEIIADIPNMRNAGVVVIDDFHRLDDDTKHIIADYLKELADREGSGTKMVLIGINRAGDSLVHFAADFKR
jgi:hypothetical protein